MIRRYSLYFIANFAVYTASDSVYKFYLCLHHITLCVKYYNRKKYFGT